MLQQFDERNRDLLVNINGKLIHRNEAGISPFDAWSHYEAPPPIIIHRALTDWVTAALQQGRLRPCEPVHVASAFMGGLQAQAILTIAGQAPASEEENERYINHLVQIHWEGLSPLSEST